LFDDEIDEIIRGILDVEQVPDQQHVNHGYLNFPQVVAEETQSTVAGQFSEAMMFPEPSENIHSSSQHYDLQASFDFNQSVTSHLHVSEAPEITSAPNIQREDQIHCQENDFLEINDLADPEPTLTNMENHVENLLFEDGLSELDLFLDAEMFIHEMGPTTHDTVSHSYMSTVDSNIENQNYQLLPNPEDANQAVGDLWMHDLRNILSPEEGYAGSISPLQTTGVVCESVNFTPEGNVNQSSTTVEDSTETSSRFSSAMWSFLESIPTTPASAAENALVNRALNRMSSFSRVKIKNTNIAAGKDTSTKKKAGMKGISFLFFPILVALCAFLWVSIGNLRLLGRCISP